MPVETEQLVFDINANVIKAKRDIRELSDTIDQLIVSLSGALSLMRRMGVSEDMEKAIGEFQRVISTLMILHRSLLLVYTSTPLGAALGVLGAIGTGLSLSDQLFSHV